MSKAGNTAHRAAAQAHKDAAMAHLAGHPGIETLNLSQIASGLSDRASEAESWDDENGTPRNTDACVETIRQSVLATEWAKEAVWDEENEDPKAALYDQKQASDAHFRAAAEHHLATIEGETND